MAIKVFPWSDVGQVSQEGFQVTEIAHTVKHAYGGGYHASRAEATKIQKEMRVTWSAMTSAQWLALVRFWRSVNGDAEAFHFEYPVAVVGWDDVADPDDGFDLELDDSTTGTKPVFLVNFTEPTLPQAYRSEINEDSGFRFRVSITVREFS
jgi:hypothetical protein